MYKVYLSNTLYRDLVQKIINILPKEMFICCGDQENSRFYPDHANEDLLSCDLFLCAAIPFDPEIGASGYVDTVLSRVVYENIPAVVIRERENCEWCGMMPVKRIEAMNIARVYEAYEDKQFKGLPIFLEETILMYKKRVKTSMVLDSDQTPNPPCGEREGYLFVSYEKTKDKLKAYPLIRNLQDHGYRVWYDDHENDAYDPEEIAGRIEQCSCMIALISPYYIDSESCKDEINLARDLNKERILVYLEKTKISTGMAMRMLRLQAIHKYTYKTRKEFYDKLYSAKGIDKAKQ